MEAGWRWVRGRSARSAAVGLVLVAGVLSSGAGTAVAQTADVDIVYACQFPSGAQQVTVRVAASLPKAGAVGQAVSPGKPTVTVTVPRAALGDVTKLDAATVGATEKLTVNVTQSGATAATVWQGLTAAQTTLPADGDLVLEASGVAQAVQPAASGKVVFTAGQLAIDLMPRKADGTATSPSMISPVCTPIGGADTTIGTVAISDGAPVSPGVGQPGTARQATAQAESDFCPPTPINELNPKFPRTPVPDSPTMVESFGDGQHSCGIVAGLSNVNKLNGATPFGGIEATNLGFRIFNDAVLDYTSSETSAVAHLEPKRATLLTFGFVPVSATMELTQIDNMNIVSEGPHNVSGVIPIDVVAQGEVSLRLTDARVNGVSLDLGPNCRAEDPVQLTLRASTADDPPYRVNLGGPLNGEITIPPFTGCGVDEDLDPLLTASVSGPGNHIQVTQGPLCLADAGTVPLQPCPPVVFGFSVNPGGPWTATSTSGFKTTILGSIPSVSISCGSVELEGKLRSGPGSAPTAISQISGVSYEGCSGTGPVSGQFTVTPVGLPWKLNADSFDPATGTTTAHVEGALLHFSTQGCSFDISDPTTSPVRGGISGNYVNSTSTMSFNLPSSRLTISNVSGCTSGFTRGITTSARAGFVTNVSFDPPQTIIQP